jgi:hypothetical protein
MGESIEMVLAAGAAPSNLTLPELEVIIERGQETFIEVGRALMEIRDRRLYRDTHATFEAYCKERWGWTRQRANQLVDAAHVATALTTDVVTNEAQARAMLANLDPEERRQVRQGIAPEGVVRKMTKPIRRPQRETPSEHTQVIKSVAHQLNSLREQYGFVSYFAPVWNAIDALREN